MALFDVNCFSVSLGMCVHFSVILPQRKVDGQIGINSVGGEKYPVLYLLHGLSDDETIWLRRTSIDRYASQKGIAVVMPTTRRGWYLDGPQGKYFTFIGKELPELVAEFFPSISQKREDTFVAGLSMGGFGAMHFGLALPEQYGAIAALSGAFDIGEEQRYKRLIAEAVLTACPEETEDDVFYLTEQLAKTDRPKPSIFMWCGTEDFLLEENHRMRDLLCQNGFDVTYTEGPGNHAWEYWDAQIQNVLDWLPIAKGQE